MEQVKDILKLVDHKNHACMDEEKLVYDGLKAMSDSDIKCLLIMKEGVLVGLFTENRYARKVLIRGNSSWKSIIGKIMETDYKTVTPESSMEECKELFKVGESRYLPVVIDGEIIGVISNTDVNESIMRDQVKEIELLKDYVYSRKS